MLDIVPYCCDAEAETENEPEFTYTVDGELVIDTVGVTA